MASPLLQHRSSLLETGDLSRSTARMMCHLLQVAAAIEGSHTASCVEVYQIFVELPAPQLEQAETGVLRFNAPTEEETTEQAEGAVFPEKCQYFVQTKKVEVGSFSDPCQVMSLIRQLDSSIVGPK